MFLYYIHCSDYEPDSPLGSISASSSQSSTATGNYPDFVLEDDEWDDPKAWKRIKEDFSEYGGRDQQKILARATEIGEGNFVLKHFFDDERYDSHEIFDAAFANDGIAIIEGIINGWLDRANWYKLEQHFCSVGPKLQWEILNKAKVDGNRNFLRIHGRYMKMLEASTSAPAPKEMPVHQSEPPKLEPVRRTRQTCQGGEHGLPPPLLHTKVNAQANKEEVIELSQYKKERIQQQQQCKQ